MQDHATILVQQIVASRRCEAGSELERSLYDKHCF